MTDDQLFAAPGKVVHLPTVLGAVVPVYNIPGVTQELKFTGQVLADIFLGKITQWNDPAIAKINDLHLGRFPLEGLARVPENGRRRGVGEMAGRGGREG
jgi:phosphate transport system substrate-binding protein